MRQLRIALTISGAIALGAYEGGALAALLLAAQEHCKGIRNSQEAPVRIDAIGCASAGAMTGVLAARTLLQGYEPVEMMYRAWVEDANVWKMLTATPHTLLSLAKLEQMVTGMLQKPTRSGAYGTPVGERYHQDRLDIVFSLACLQGLDYQIRHLSDTTHTDAITYVDLKRFTVHHVGGDTNLTPYVGTTTPRSGVPSIDPRFTSLVAYAMASGANEFGFAPALLNRAAERRAYQRNGIAHPYEWLWYTDGGTLDNEPLGRTLDISDELDSTMQRDDEFRRLHLLIHPQPDRPQRAGTWTNRDRQPDWTATLAHSWKLVRSQHLYDDLRRMEKTNAHIVWTDRLEQQLTALLDAFEQSDHDAFELRRTELDQLERGIRDEKHRLRAARSAEPAESEGGVATTRDRSANAELVHQLLREASGIGERQRVRAEVISPLLLLKGAPTTSVDRLLAGEMLGSFGGFLGKKLRQSDFQLGFLSILQWMQDIRQRSVHDPIVGEHDATYETMLREFAAAGLPAVERQASDLVRRMRELDYLALRPWLRPFAGKPPAQPLPAADSGSKEPEGASSLGTHPPQRDALADRAEQARTRPDVPTQRPPMQLLYKTQGPRTLISLPAAWVIVPLLAIKVMVMFLYERILWSLPERLVVLFRRRSQGPGTPATT